MNEKLWNAPIGIIETTADGEIRAANEEATSLIERDIKRVVGSSILEEFPESATGTLHTAFANGPPRERSFEEYYPTVDRWFEIDIVPTDEDVLIYVRDCSSRMEDRNRIDTLQRRLDKLETIDSLIPAVLKRLITASSRDEISRELCERLGATDLYEFTWVGERSVADSRLNVVAAAGQASDMRDELEEQLAAGATLPERTAVEEAETQVVQRLAEIEDIPHSVRVAAFGRGLQSCIAVPLIYGDNVYGVLGVYSTRKDGFGEQERRGLETLGDIAGFAVKAIRQEDLLFAETVTELTLSVRDDRIPLLEASRRADGRLTVDGVVPQDDDSVLCYVRVAGDVDAAMDLLNENEHVEAVRTVGGEDETSLVQARIDDWGPIPVLVAWGGTIRAATYTADEARVVVDLPSDVDLRRVVDAIDQRFTETELIAKTEQSREADTAQSFESELQDRLTDKQLQVLETAYRSEYFNSPRGSTSAEVGDALDISGPTVLYHLRRGQRKLLSSFFESGTSTEEGNPGNG